MKTRDDDSRSGRDWRDDPSAEWSSQGPRQHEAFQGRSTQMGASGYGGRESPWSGDAGRSWQRPERSGLSGEDHRRTGDDYERGYWGNDFDRGDVDPFEHGQSVPTGPRTWGSGIGSGVQGRGMGQGRHSDPDYQQWRNEQLERFDDDFEAFRRERYGKFAEEFNTWRSNRANQKPSSENPGTGSSDSSSSSLPAGSRSSEGSQTKQHG
jgi:hypothetical protein